MIENAIAAFLKRPRRVSSFCHPGRASCFSPSSFLASEARSGIQGKPSACTSRISVVSGFRLAHPGPRPGRLAGMTKAESSRKPCAARFRETTEVTNNKNPSTRLLKNCCEARLRCCALLAPSPICLICLGRCAACALHPGFSRRFSTACYVLCASASWIGDVEKIFSVLSVFSVAIVKGQSSGQRGSPPARRCCQSRAVASSSFSSMVSSRRSCIRWRPATQTSVTASRPAA